MGSDGKEREKRSVGTPGAVERKYETFLTERISSPFNVATHQAFLRNGRNGYTDGYAAFFQRKDTAHCHLKRT